MAKENPRTYLPDVAMTLNNLANLHFKKNNFREALVKYEEALRIFRELAKENPRVYDIDYAQTLIMGVVLFNKDTRLLNEAKVILAKYPDVYRARQWLTRIDALE